MLQTPSLKISYSPSARLFTHKNEFSTVDDLPISSQSSTSDKEDEISLSRSSIPFPGPSSLLGTLIFLPFPTTYTNELVSPTPTFWTNVGPATTLTIPTSDLTFNRASDPDPTPSVPTPELPRFTDSSRLTAWDRKITQISSNLPSFSSIIDDTKIITTTWNIIPQSSLSQYFESQEAINSIVDFTPDISPSTTVDDISIMSSAILLSPSPLSPIIESSIFSSKISSKFHQTSSVQETLMPTTTQLSSASDDDTSSICDVCSSVQSSLSVMTGSSSSSNDVPLTSSMTSSTIVPIISSVSSTAFFTIPSVNRNIPASPTRTISSIFPEFTASSLSSSTDPAVTNRPNIGAAQDQKFWIVTGKN